MLAGVIEGNHLLEVGLRRRDLAKGEQGQPQVPVAQRYLQGVLDLLGQAEGLLRELARPAMLGPDVVKDR